ncbi:MAG: hypothetical protein ACPGRZ_02565 [Alphaproteobacteria bacterium]
MAYSLEDFCADARGELKRDNGPEGRERIARHLEKLLVDPEFVATHLGPDKRSGAETIYADPDYDFRVMAHTNRGASNNTPHCHGPSWVIYGMAMNHVEMTEWKREDDGSVDGHADLSVARTYVLNEGEAHVYNEGVIHSLNRPLETRLVRVTGCDLDKTLRYRYDPANNAVKVLAPVE